MTVHIRDYSLTNSDFSIARKLYTDLKSYWLSLYREQDRIPNRSQFNPAKIRNLIPFLYMVERTEDAKMKVRHRSSGIEEATQFRFLAGEHLQNYTEEEWEQLERYFKTIFAGPYGTEGDWRYFTSDQEVYDAATYSLPLYGRDETQKLSVGVMVLRQNFDQDLIAQCTDKDRSELLHAIYLDIGFGQPSGAITVTGR